MGSSASHYYDMLEEERWNALSDRAKKNGMTPSEQQAHDKLVDEVRRGRDLFNQREREDRLISLYLANKHFVQR
jgi:hypothetical protein